jgi:ribosomal protein L37AE/L43A
MEEVCPICRRYYIREGWWSCKKCSKRMRAKEYNKFLIDHIEIIKNNIKK